MMAETYTDHANDVMEKIAGFLIDEKIITEGDCSCGCVYFNDTAERKTYRIVFEECEYYEGE